MSQNGSNAAHDRRIDSWKEIATFFGRDERTVKRWEKSKFLPVHRIPGSGRGGVFAYTLELTRWLNTPLAEKDNPKQPHFHPLLEQSLPAEPKPLKVDEVIKQLSPDFVRIHAEASTAEAYNLTEIAGPGYRKALEFLVKDYAIKLNPADAAKIKKITLGTVISDYLAGDKLTVVSCCATWLGNDETHYERKWVGKDLADLKQLIGATAHFMAYELLAASLHLDMPDPKNNTPCRGTALPETQELINR